jgi:hypothetical protein
MSQFRLSLLSLAGLTTIILLQQVDHSAAQEVGLTPLETTEVAKGYSADALKLKTVVNEKNEPIARINDFIFGRDGNIYVVLAVDGTSGLVGHLVAIPFRRFKLDDPSDRIVLPGTNRVALQKLPVYLGQ